MRMKKLLVVFSVMLLFELCISSEGGYGLFAQRRLQNESVLNLLELQLNFAEEKGDKKEAERLRQEIQKLRQKLQQEGKAEGEDGKTQKFGGIAGDDEPVYIESNAGYCTGDYVRVREKPTTDSEIFGRVHKGDKLIVVDKRSNNNQLWYKIKNPFGNGTAWISANYVQISGNASGQKSVPVKTANYETQQFGGNNTRTTSAASSQNIYDVPDFFALNDGNLRAVEKRHGTGHRDNAYPHKYYNYECDVHKYNNYIERYVQQLSSYNFSLTTHYLNDHRIVAHKVNILESETWVFSYNGSKQVRNFRVVNIKTPKSPPHITPFVISKYVYHREGVTKILLEIADELTYAGENAFTDNVRSTQTRQPSSDSSSYSSSSGTSDIRHTCFTCHGSGTVDCSVCGGDGGRYEYDSSTPNYAGRTDSAYYASKRVWVPCRNFKCRNGKVECSRCNGTGYVN